MSKFNVQLLVIDPQMDFMDEQGAALRVAGATDDMKRLAKFVTRVGKKLTDIHVTLDSHRVIDVGHPGFWRDQNGKSPNPFTMIMPDDIANGICSPRDPSLIPRMLAYSRELASKGQYNIMVWPEHCLIGSPGHNVQPDLLTALQEWERSEYASINYITKGTNIYTEHYGALQAEVPDPLDPDTSLNTSLLQMMQKADQVVVAGEASSHCVLSTVNQIAENIGEEHIKKFVLLTDCMSPVGALPGADFPAIAAEWMKNMEKKGMKLATSDSYLR
jgi:nicotinamidase-related amidase